MRTQPVRLRLKERQVKALKALDERRFGVLICHRRWGKTVLSVARLCRNATEGTSEYRGAYIAPTYRQAKDVAWDYLRKIANDLGAKVNEGELRVDFENGSRIKLYGAENPDSLRGLNLCDVVFDEVAQMPWSVWAEIVLPMLVSTHGRALFLGTPQGHNALLRIWEQAKIDSEWASGMYRASESGVFTEEELAVARKNMSEEEYEQEYECSFLAAVRGSYYGRDLEQAEKEGRITSVPYNPDAPAFTAWDLGFSDSTAIWIAQIVGREVHVVDYIEGSGRGLDYYTKGLQKLPYTYTTHIYPHDVAMSELGTGTSRLETLRKLGFPGRVLPAIKVDDGINAVRNLLPRCWFDAKRCARGIDCLRMYQREWNEKTQSFRSSPLHDWTSHGADSFRYLAMGLDNAVAASSGFVKLSKMKGLRVC